MINKSLFSILLFLSVFFLLFNISCWEEKTTSPSDDKVVDTVVNGDYKFELDSLYKKVTVHQLKHLKIPFAVGEDTFKVITPDLNVLNFIDTSNFYNTGDSVINIIPVANGFDTITINCIVDAITPDSSIYSSSTILTIVNGVQIEELKGMLISPKDAYYKILNVDSSVDSSYKVNWILPDTSFVLNGDDTLKLTLKDTATVKVQAVLQDKYGNIADTVRTFTSKSWTTPIIEVFDSTIFDTLLIDSANVLLKSKSDYGILGISLLIDDSSFNASKVNDSLWVYTIKGLKSTEALNVKAVVLDSFSFSDTISFTLYHDATKEDKVGPGIMQIAGPVNGERVTSAVDTMIFEIKDPSIVDSIYCVLNDSVLLNVANLGADTYSVTLSFSKFGNNKVTIWASDNSTNDNFSTKDVTVNYNTIPSGFSIIAPANGAAGVENVGGVKLNWNPSIDIDGDSLYYYRIFYGTSISSMISVDVQDSFCTLSVPGDDTAYWYAEVAHGIDTIRYPSVATQFYGFSTLNHPTVITGFADQTCTINDSITLAVTATDPEGIKEYQWDYNNDGVSDIITSVGSAKIKASNLTGEQTIVLSVVDNKGNVVKDTAVITISNDNPTLSVSVDKTEILIGDSIEITVAFSDDGVVNTYMNTTGNWELSNKTTIKEFPVLYPIPSNLTYKFRAEDDDGHIVEKEFTISIKPYIDTLFQNDSAYYLVSDFVDTSTTFDDTMLCRVRVENSLGSGATHGLYLIGTIESFKEGEANWAGFGSLSATPMSMGRAAAFSTGMDFGEYYAINTSDDLLKWDLDVSSSQWSGTVFGKIPKGYKNTVSNLVPFFNKGKGWLYFGGCWLTKDLLVMSGVDDTLYYTKPISGGSSYIWQNSGVIVEGFREFTPYFANENECYIIHGRGQRKLLKLSVTESSSFVGSIENVTKMFDKNIPINIPDNAAISKIDNDLILVSGKNVYVSSDDGDSWQHVLIFDGFNKPYRILKWKGKIIVGDVNYIGQPWSTITEIRYK